VSVFARINGFLESKLRVRSYPLKVVLLFALLIFFSMFFSFAVDVFRSLKEVKEELRTAAVRAAMFRTTAINNTILTILQSDVSLALLIEREGLESLEPFLGNYILCARGEDFYRGAVDILKVEEAISRSKGRAMYFHLYPENWLGVAVVKVGERVYAFCHSVPHLRQILNKNLGAISKYGAEFFYGERPEVSEDDIFVVFENTYSNANMYVVIPSANLFKTLIRERIILYVRLYLIFLLFLSFSYLFWAKVINYPIRKLRKVVEELEKGNYSVDFSELTSARDEFGLISRLLSSFSQETKRRLQKMELILETAFNPVSSPEEANTFVRMTLNRLDEILSTDGSLFIAQDIQSGKLSIFVPSNRLKEEDVEVLVSLFRAKSREAPSRTEELACFKETAGERCIGLILFNLGTESKGAVIIILKEDLDKETESYLKVVSQHLIGMMRLSHLASTDPLTGVPNRRMLELDLKRYGKLATRYKNHLSLIMLDLDNFKVINDTYGHQIGDEVLKEIARLIQRNIRDTDTLYRYGGEEFAILCPQTDKEGAYELAERIRNSIKNHRFWVVGERYIYVTVSLGIASYPEDTEKAGELLAIADISLYKAKNEGKNRTAILIGNEYREVYLRRFKKEKDLVELLHSGSVTHELQPIFNIQNNTVYGYELLFRVVNNGEVVPIGKFVGQIEDVSIVEEIDLYTVEKLTGIIRSDRLSSLCFFINISPKTLERGNILSVLSGIPKHMRSRIFIEITEKETFYDLDQAVDYFEILKTLGFRVVMDDFGSGSSSISYMRHFIKFIDLIKVDGMFVKNVSIDPYNRAILESIKTMAGRFSIDVVAEHIESEEDLITVRKMGIRFGQGYYFARTHQGITA
jgi:diguanylate cyclase (GGDEF)-like protein